MPETVSFHANGAGVNKKNPFFDSPGTNSLDSLSHDLMGAFGSNGSKVVTFDSPEPNIVEPVSPPKIKRTTGITFPDLPPVEKVTVSPCDSSTMATSITHSEGPSSILKGKGSISSPSPSDTSTWATEGTSKKSKTSKANSVAWEMNSTLRKKIKGMKKIIPKMIQAMNGTAPKKVDLTGLTVATLCLMPRNGAGMEEGRKCFERMRTSLMLHLIQQQGNGSWMKQDSSKFEGEKARKQKGQIAKLNNVMYDCISDNDGTFTEKTQDIVQLVKEAKEAIEEVAESRGDQSQTKKALEVRNMTCLKLLSGMYRDVVSTYDASYEHNDGLALMVVASAYFAMGRFDTALAIYQKAGAKLREKLSTDPECIVHCAKLFNNMGVVYYEMKKYEKAMQTFQRALQLFHDENEDNYSYWVSAIMDQASIMNNMAYTLIKFKLYDDASDLVDASFELQQLLPGNFSMTANSIMTVSTLSSMAFIYQRTKKYKPALDTYTACAQLQAKSPIHGDNDKVDILKKMVGITKKVKNQEKRVQLLRCILLYQQTYCTEEDEEIWETNKQLGEALQCLAEMDGVSV
ncbi:hypothetical protein ACHAWO_000939 [Cyclotella atomus]|uniref:Uncharacterized protein n=1 Tax=Cyclotella atomus TaxID=382360 RepID=A0ABD3N4N2_9STRA